MAAQMRCDDALPLVGAGQIMVDVDLGLFLPDGPGDCGGILRRIPSGLATAVEGMGP
ncbi:hypothetical protein AB0E88_27765 [Streptomyces sp. NPDC028635]|uniref:hypothetical protein n=1 Tax=Streptomyces sp. NPDC028635 TaxID=3154800 RepID=UPI0033F6BCD4